MGKGVLVELAEVSFVELGKCVFAELGKEVFAKLQKIFGAGFPETIQVNIAVFWYSIS